MKSVLLLVCSYVGRCSDGIEKNTELYTLYTGYDDICLWGLPKILILSDILQLSNPRYDINFQGSWLCLVNCIPCLLESNLAGNNTLKI